MKKEMMEWQWHQLDHATSAPHHSIFYRPDTVCTTDSVWPVKNCPSDKQNYQ